MFNIDIVSYFHALFLKFIFESSQENNQYENHDRVTSINLKLIFWILFYFLTILSSIIIIFLTFKKKKNEFTFWSLCNGQFINFQTVINHWW